MWANRLAGRVAPIGSHGTRHAGPHQAVPDTSGFHADRPGTGPAPPEARSDAASRSALWTLEGTIFNAHPISCSV